jgi:uncharacterized protein YecE (DUF72 family)
VAIWKAVEEMEVFHRFRAYRCGLNPLRAPVMTEIRIGTSGWHYKHWKGNFYPEKITAAQMLPWYVRSFRTVEINNSHYRLPTREAVDTWLALTPPDFCFAVKAHRFITHRKKLLDPEQSTLRFFEMADWFRKKLGPILFQLPGQFKANADRLRDFIASLPRGLQYAFEFRDPSWHTETIYKVLRRYGAAFCIFEFAGLKSSFEVTANFVYVRLHGPGHAYQGKYSEFVLQEWAKRLSEWAAQNCDPHIYFDNDQAGYAAQNALELRRMITGSV